MSTLQFACLSKQILKWHGYVPDHRREEVFLRGKIDIDRALRDPDPIRDIFQARCGEAICHERVIGRVQDLERSKSLLLGPR